jgi:hypothetical protein
MINGTTLPIRARTSSDIVSTTACLDHDPTVALMTPLPDQCAPDSELLSATIGPMPHRQFSFLTHTRHFSQDTYIINHILTTKGKLTK